MTTTLINIEDMTEEERFEQCLKEAEELCYGVFSPELDNLVKDDITSIMFKVLIEYDLLTEGESHFDGVSEEEKEEWKYKVTKFFRRWRDWNNDLRERRLYSSF